MATAKKTPSPSLRQFFSDVLGGIGAPATEENITFLYAQALAENGAIKNGYNQGNGAVNNPLDTTQPWPNDSNFNSFGPNGEYHVRNYATYSDGVNATVKTMLGGYPGIVADLQNGSKNAEDIVNDNGSELGTWGTGAQATYNQIGLARSGINLGVSPGRGGGVDVVGGVKTAVSTVTGAPGKIAGTVESDVTKGLSTAGMYILYGMIALGGVAVLLVGLILIGVDVGVAGAVVRKFTPVGKAVSVAGKVTGAPAQRRAKKATAARTQRTTERATEIQESKARQQQHRERLESARVKTERTRNRNLKGTRPRQTKPLAKGERVIGDKQGRTFTVHSSEGVKQVNRQSGQEIPF